MFLISFNYGGAFMSLDRTYRCLVPRSSGLVKDAWIIRIVGMGLASEAPVAQLGFGIKRNPTFPVLHVQED